MQNEGQIDYVTIAGVNVNFCNLYFSDAWKDISTVNQIFHLSTFQDYFIHKDEQVSERRRQV